MNGLSRRNIILFFNRQTSYYTTTQVPTPFAEEASIGGAIHAALQMHYLYPQNTEIQKNGLYGSSYFIRIHSLLYPTPGVQNTGRITCCNFGFLFFFFFLRQISLKAFYEPNRPLYYIDRVSMIFKTFLCFILFINYIFFIKLTFIDRFTYFHFMA